MTKHALTKNHSEILETYGVMQNLSSDDSANLLQGTKVPVPL